MKVLHIELGRHLFGGPRQVANLLAGMTRGEHVLVCEQSSEIAHSFHHPAIRMHKVKLGLLDEGDVRLIGQLRRIIREEKPTLVHVHGRRGDFLSGWAAHKEGVPLILSRRTDEPTHAFDRRLKFPLFQHVIAISPRIAEITHDAGVPAEHITVVTDGVETDKFQPLEGANWLRGGLRIAPERPLLGIVAYLIPRKGHALLLDAMTDVLARHPGAILLIYGKGRLEGEIRRTIADKGFGDSVQLMGYRTDMHRVVPCLDLVVHPAKREGMGVALLEAAACGVPIVATRVGGIPEIVQDGLNGLLIEPDDRAGLANAINRMLSNPAEMRSMGAAGRTVAIEKFSVARMIEGNMRVYDRVAAELAGRPVPAPA
jgi:glycosyltransferase involved in cell wall biosynthesis